MYIGVLLQISYLAWIVNIIFVYCITISMLQCNISICAIILHIVFITFILYLVYFLHFYMNYFIRYVRLVNIIYLFQNYFHYLLLNFNIFLTI